MICGPGSQWLSCHFHQFGSVLISLTHAILVTLFSIWTDLRMFDYMDYCIRMLSLFSLYRFGKFLWVPPSLFSFPLPCSRTDRPLGISEASLPFQRVVKDRRNLHPDPRHVLDQATGGCSVC